MKDTILQVHKFLPFSRSNGPGVRSVLWVQGCSLRCPGCFNPATHPFEGGDVMQVDTLFQRLLALQGNLEGVTVSGGEPLEQRLSVTALLHRVKTQTLLSVILFTGFTWEEVQRLGSEVLWYVDVLIAGRYDYAHRLARGLCGSTNQTIHCLTGRYTMADLQSLPPAEVVITPKGEVVLSGIQPVGVYSTRT